MKRLLLDTHVLLWPPPAAAPADRGASIADDDNEVLFGAASLWEITIKRHRDDCEVDPRVLRRSLLDNGYVELAIRSDHAVAIEGLPPIHKDPFDRMLVAQATIEGVTLLTADPVVATYPGPIQKIR